LLNEIPKQHGARPVEVGLQDETPSLSEFGVSKIQSHRWQMMVKLSGGSRYSIIQAVGTTQIVSTRFPVGDVF
jgi:hypothetical protein